MKKIDDDDQLYLRMLKTPALISDKSTEEYEDELAVFLRKIIEQSKERAIIRTDCMWSGYMENIRKYGMERHMKVMKQTTFIASHTPRIIKKSKWGQFMKQKLLKKV